MRDVENLISSSDGKQILAIQSNGAKKPCLFMMLMVVTENK